MEQPDDMTSCQKPWEEEHTPQYLWVHFSLCTVYGNCRVHDFWRHPVCLKLIFWNTTVKHADHPHLSMCVYIFKYFQGCTALGKRCKARLYPQLVHIPTWSGSCSTVSAWRRRPPSDLHWRRTSAEDGGQEQDEKIKFRDFYMSKSSIV